MEHLGPARRGGVVREPFLDRLGPGHIQGHDVSSRAGARRDRWGLPRRGEHVGFLLESRFDCLAEAEVEMGPPHCARGPGICRSCAQVSWQSTRARAPRSRQLLSLLRGEYIDWQCSLSVGSRASQIIEAVCRGVRGASVHVPGHGEPQPDVSHEAPLPGGAWHEDALRQAASVVCGGASLRVPPPGRGGRAPADLGRAIADMVEFGRHSEELANAATGRSIELQRGG